MTLKQLSEEWKKKVIELEEESLRRQQKGDIENLRKAVELIIKANQLVECILDLQKNKLI